MQSEKPTTEQFTRKEVNAAATRLAASIQRFMDETHPHLSMVRRYSLMAAMLQLEALADGR